MYIRAPQSVEINHTEFAAIVRYVVVMEPNLMEAIKRLRSIFGLGLLEAKHLVDAAVSDPLLLEIRTLGNKMEAARSRGIQVAP